MLSMHTYKRFVSKHGNVIFSITLAIFWTLGLVFGYTVATKISISLLMRAFTLERVSIVGLILATILPLIISATAVRLSVPFLILPTAFIKASLFSFCACALTLVYNDAGWLARWLYIFTDSIMVIFLLRLWIRNALLSAKTFQKDLLICLIAASILICIDYFIVSPFSVMLFNYS